MSRDWKRTIFYAPPEKNIMRRLCAIFALIVLCPAVFLAADTNIPWAGGPVIQNARIILIYWGTPDPSFRSSLDRFYSQIVRVPYLNRLSEYSTGAVKPGPTAFRQWFGNPLGQVIGGGNFVGSYIVEPNVLQPNQRETWRPRTSARNWIMKSMWAIFRPPTAIPFTWFTSLRHGICTSARTFSASRLVLQPVRVFAPITRLTTRITSRAIVYGAVPNQAAIANCRGAGSPLDAETAAASHELIQSGNRPRRGCNRRRLLECRSRKWRSGMAAVRRLPRSRAR